MNKQSKYSNQIKFLESALTKLSMADAVIGFEYSGLSFRSDEIKYRAWLSLSAVIEDLEYCLGELKTKEQLDLERGVIYYGEYR